VPGVRRDYVETNPGILPEISQGLASHIDMDSVPAETGAGLAHVSVDDLSNPAGYWEDILR